MTEPISQIPVTIVGGFLGAGKTTLVNHILNGDHGERCLVLVNDFGEIDIDTLIIQARSETVISLANGCICCTVQNDMVRQLAGLLASSDGALPERIVIETSGLSDPAKVVQAIRYPELRGHLRTDAVLILVDSSQFTAMAPDMRQVAEDQIAAGDIIVLNKTDLADRADIERFKQEWTYPGARLFETVKAAVPFEIVFGGGHSSADGPAVSHDHLDQHSAFATWSWCGKARFSAERLRRGLRTLPTDVFRGKGVFACDDGAVPGYVFHLVGQRIDFDPAPPGLLDTGTASLVFIGRSEAMVPDLFLPIIKNAIVDD